MKISILPILVLVTFAMMLNVSAQNRRPVSGGKTIQPAAAYLPAYLPLLKGKRIAVVANPTSTIGQTHLVDTLTSLGITIRCIFGPEHGFRGNEPDGKGIANETDPATGIPVISLYGDHKKPLPADLNSVDLVVFDIQDVGVRFYTYISTLTLVMEACAEKDIPLLLLDRPNPHGYYVDGPVLDTAFASFVGMHPVPVVYGMTIGEYARMVNGENWLPDGRHCELTVIPCRNYTHASRYALPVRPSPNLPDMNSVYLYPSLCLFEGTIMSVGRGTRTPFRMYGHPEYPGGNFEFRPEPIPGMSENPPFKGQLCRGVNVEDQASVIRTQGHLELSWLLDACRKMNKKENFFSSYFDKLAGNDLLRRQILEGKSEKEIRKSWAPDLHHFMKIRKKYLLYRDF
jgi:uncharacterized protein YbbC (DUF1343 family)